MKKLVLIIVLLYGCTEATINHTEYASKAVEAVKAKGEYNYVLGPTEVGKSVLYTIDAGVQDADYVRLWLISSLGEMGADYTMPWAYNAERQKYEGSYNTQNVRVDISYSGSLLSLVFTDTSDS